MCLFYTAPNSCDAQTAPAEGSAHGAMLPYLATTKPVRDWG